MNKSKIIANQGLSQCLSYLGSISNMHGMIIDSYTYNFLFILINLIYFSTR